MAYEHLVPGSCQVFTETSVLFRCPLLRQPMAEKGFTHPLFDFLQGPAAAQRVEFNALVQDGGRLALKGAPPPDRRRVPPVPGTKLDVHRLGEGAPFPLRAHRR